MFQRLAYLSQYQSTNQVSQEIFSIYSKEYSAGIHGKEYTCIPNLIVHRFMAKKENKPSIDFAFGKENYVLVIIAIALIFIGFVCMSGGGSKDPAVWDPSIFSFRRITLAPILVIGGFVVAVVAVLKKSKE